MKAMPNLDPPALMVPLEQDDPFDEQRHASAYDQVGKQVGFAAQRARRIPACDNGKSAGPGHQNAQHRHECVPHVPKQYAREVNEPLGSVLI